MPIIDEIIGRMYAITEDGRKINRFHNIFYNIDNLIESQIIQKEFDSFDINPVVSNLDKSIEKIISVVCMYVR